MNWLFMTPVEAAVLWSVVASLALWLYLHQRHPVRRRVSTLRFWSSLESSPRPRRRRRLREPWAWLAQVVFLLLLILALANLRWGEVRESRRVAIIVDTTVWSQAHAPGGAPWADQVRQEAQRVLDSLPSDDPVLLLRGEADASPILPFSTDRAALRRAIAQAPVSNSVADIPRVLQRGRAALAGARRGLLIYVGPGMLDQQQQRQLSEFREKLEPAKGTGEQPQFLARLVGGSGPLENRGITRLALRRDSAQPDRWRLLTQVTNYSATPAKVLLKLTVNGQSLRQETLSIAPFEAAQAHDGFVWSQGGLLQAEISPGDGLDPDNRAVAYLPSFRPVRVAVFTATAAGARELRPVLASNPYWRTEFVKPGGSPAAPPEVAIYEGVNPPPQNTVNAIWFRSGPRAGGGTPAGRSVRLVGWNVQHPVTRWVRTHDVSVRNPATLNVQPGDVVLASGEGNPSLPLMLAREQNGHKLLIIGFDPRDSNFPLQPAFPLLMAAGVEWMTHPVDDVTDSAFTGEVDLPGPASRILSPSGKTVPFARQGAQLHLLADETGIYRIQSGAGETRVAMNLPPLPSQRWRPTSLELESAAAEPLSQGGSDLWRWLVLLAMVVLWLEWWLYHRSAALGNPLAPGREGPAPRQAGRTSDGETSSQRRKFIS